MIRFGFFPETATAMTRLMQPMHTGYAHARLWSYHNRYSSLLGNVPIVCTWIRRFYIIGEGKLKELRIVSATEDRFMRACGYWLHKNAGYSAYAAYSCNETALFFFFFSFGSRAMRRLVRNTRMPRQEKKIAFLWNLKSHLLAAFAELFSGTCRDKMG